MKVQKRLAAEVLKCSKNRIVFDSSRLSEIKEAITKGDIRKLIADGAISKLQKKGISNVRAKKLAAQKSKGRRKRRGSRKGTKNARSPGKNDWILRIRKQRELLKSLKRQKLLKPADYKNLYLKSKGGFFRSRKHLHLYAEEHGLIKK